MEDAYVVFSIDNALYALPSNCIKEVLRMKDVKLYKFPLRSELVKGMVNLRGVIFPALCGKALLKENAGCGVEPSRMIVVSHRSVSYGLLVDGIVERVLLQDGQRINDNIEMVDLEDCLRWCASCRG